MLAFVKHKRLKMSPAGMISLPVAARKTLGMKLGAGALEGVEAKDDCINLVGTSPDNVATIRVSKRGQTVLPPTAPSLSEQS